MREATAEARRPSASEACCVASHDGAGMHGAPRLLDRYVRLSAKLLGVPMALISVIEPGRQRFLASVGLTAPLDERGEVPLSHSFCQHVVVSGRTMAITDARTDERVSSNPAVCEFGVVSYLGVPIREEGQPVIGSLCVTDGVPRSWSRDEQALLEDLAAAVAADFAAQRAYGALTTITEQYRALLDTTTELVCTADLDGIITFANAAWCRAFGYADVQALGLRALDLVTTEHKGRFVDVARRLQTGEPIEDFEVVALAVDGRRVVCRGRASIILERSDDGTYVCTGTRAVYRDVTRERQLEASRARLVATLEATSDFVGIAGHDGQIEYVNAAGRRLLGVADDTEVSTMSADQFHPPETLATLVQDGFPTAVRDGMWRGAGALRNQDGETIPVSIVMTSHPAMSPEAPRFFSAIMRDQRAEVAAAKALQTSEALFRAMVENAAVGVSVIAPSGTILRTNAAFDAMLGHAPGSLIGRFAPELSPPEEAIVTREAVRALRAGEIERVSVEKRFFRADGDIRVLTLSLSLVPLNDGSSAVLGLASDVTDRVSAEQALAKERAFLSATLESLSDGVVACDEHGTLVLFNAATRALHGADQLPLGPGQWAGTYDIFRADGRTPMPVDEIPLYRALVHGVVKHAEMVIAPIGGVPRSVVASGKALLASDGRVQGAVVAMRDVTAERAAERALRDSEERYRQLIDMLPDGVIKHVGGKIAFANAAMARIVGVADPADLVGQSVHALLGAEDVHAAVLRAEASLDRAAGGASWREEVLRRDDGTTVPCEIVGTRVDASGAAGVLSVVRDVSARRQQERALREREAQLAAIYNHSSDVMILLRVERDARGLVSDYRCDSVNEPLLAVKGIGADAYVGRTLREFAEPDRYARFRARCDDAVRSGQTQQLELPTQGVNGPVIFESTITPIRDAAGRCTHLLSANRDVTARRGAEAALQRSELAFRTMLQTVRSVAVTLDSDARVTFANEALLSLTGWTQAEVIGAEWFTMFTAEPQMMRLLFDCVIAGKEPVPHYENELLTRDGQRRLIVWDNTVLRNAEGDIVGTASIGQDVTDQRALQARLAALSEQDELTGLLNRRGFSKRVTQGLRQVRRSRRHDVLLYLDLDRFKPINDTYGHAAGDQALRDISALLEETIRDTDVAGRLGGDEFAVYASHLETAEAGVFLLQRLQDAVARHNAEEARNGRPYALEFSAGLAVVLPDDTEEELFARADAALYAIKHGRL